MPTSTLPPLPAGFHWHGEDATLSIRCVADASTDLAIVMNHGARFRAAVSLHRPHRPVYRSIEHHDRALRWVAGWVVLNAERIAEDMRTRRLRDAPAS